MGSKSKRKSSTSDGKGRRNRRRFSNIATTTTITTTPRPGRCNGDHFGSKNNDDSSSRGTGSSTRAARSQKTVAPYRDWRQTRYHLQRAVHQKRFTAHNLRKERFPAHSLGLQSVAPSREIKHPSETDQIPGWYALKSPRQATDTLSRVIDVIDVFKRRLCLNRQHPWVTRGGDCPTCPPTKLFQKLFQIYTYGIRGSMDPVLPPLHLNCTSLWGDKPLGINLG